ncbi:MFS transporter [Bacillaceae bacterium]
MVGNNREMRIIFAVLLMNAVFSTVVVFSNIYVNIFLWNQEKSLVSIGLYNAFVFLFVFLGTLFGAYLMKWISSRATFNMSAMFMLFVFGLLITQGNDIARFIPFLGALYGLASGLYYSGFNLFSIFLTNAENRQRFVSLDQLTNRLTSILVPLAFSYIIVRYDYRDTFRLIFLFLILQVVISLFSPRYKSDFSLSSLRYRDIWREYRLVLISIMAFGFFQSMVLLAGSVLLFSYEPRETLVGWYNAFFAFLGILTLLAIGRPVLRRQRMKIAYAGAIVATFMTILLFIPNRVTLIIFNIFAAVALPLIWVPVSVTHYGKIKELACESENQCDVGLAAHYLLIREFMLNLGRCLFYLLLIAGLDFVHMLHYVPILIVSLLIPFTIYFCNTRLFEEEKNRD